MTKAQIIKILEEMERKLSTMSMEELREVEEYLKQLKKMLGLR